MLYVCMAPSAQYMKVDPFKGEMCESGFVSKLAKFTQHEALISSSGSAKLPGC